MEKQSGVKHYHIIETYRSAFDRSRVIYLIETKIYDIYKELTSLLKYKIAQAYPMLTHQQKQILNQYDAVKWFRVKDEEDRNFEQDGEFFETAVDYWCAVIEYLLEHNLLMSMEENQDLNITVHIDKYVNHFIIDNELH
jgi:hypothetical protein